MNPTQTITLEDLIIEFQMSQSSRLWYVEGKKIKFQLPVGVVDINTFVLLHSQGKILVGYMGYVDGCLTFFPQEDLSTISELRRYYTKLLFIEGFEYHV